MRNHTSKKAPHEESEKEQEAEIRHRTGKDEEEEITEEYLVQDDADAEDHTMERLDEDDLANMQGPDA